MAKIRMLTAAGQSDDLLEIRNRYFYLMSKDFPAMPDALWRFESEALTFRYTEEVL